MNDQKISTWFFCPTYSFKTCREVCQRRRSMPNQYKKCTACSLIEKILKTDPNPAQLTA